jgi:glycine/D-amino acid oxidase-like deaminating enzyme
VSAARIAILGGGMLGACTALELARRGLHTTVFEGAPELLQGASRWSEGKIHLGFLYAADPTLSTAKRLIPGGLAFANCVSELVGKNLHEFATMEDELFLVHRDSVVDHTEFEAYARHTASLVREAASVSGSASYLTDVSSASIYRLSAAELSQVTCSCEVIAGYRVPERSVSTVAVADLISSAVSHETRITVHTNAWVTAVRRRIGGRLDVLTTTHGCSSTSETFDVVINALWEGRLAVDATLGLRPSAPWSHRFRAAVFVDALQGPLQSAVLCTGPFGDIKRYADGRSYLSWYSAGLLAEGHDIEPPRASANLTAHRRKKILQDTVTGLAPYFPSVRDLSTHAKGIRVQGGWVYAIGQGSLGERSSTLHQRDKFEITIDGGYISADTAKYSLAPWLARRIADTVCAD